jgi:cytosine/adenosine deaminase-related metal-dependent hydrolase
MPPPNSETIEADLLIDGATLITLNAERHVIKDILGDRIVAVGKRADLAPRIRAKETRDGRRFVVTPGFVDGHIHITGDPLTRGLIRGGPDEPWSERMNRWVIPLFRGQTPADERIAAQCAALNMMRYGTTCFLEAGTVLHLDAVMDGLAETGIRGRVGEWVEGRAWDPAADPAEVSAAAIAILQSEIERYPANGAKLAACPILVGHNTNSGDVWRAAKALADQHGLVVSAHMSPYASDGEWYMANYGRRPLEWLADLGVLGTNMGLTHLADLDHSELDLLVQSGTTGIHCPQAAYLGGYGLSQGGLFPEMLGRGANVMLGTDGAPTDILSSGRLMASLFRDARRDADLIPAGQVLEMATLNGARGMGLSDSIGSLEAGKKADFVLHDAHRAEWGGPVFDPVLQLAMYASSGGVHSVWIDGVQVIDDGRATLVDEDKILADARQAGTDLVARLGLPVRTTWPVV